MIDGCSEMKAMWKVMIPMASPGIITVTIFNFMNIWNEYFMALIFANGNDKIRTLSMGLQNMITSMKYTGDWAGLFAGVIIVLVPTLILYLLLSEKNRGQHHRRCGQGLSEGRCTTAADVVKIPQEGRAGSALPDIYVICADSRGRRRAFGAPQLSVCAFGKEMNDEKTAGHFRCDRRASDAGGVQRRRARVRHGADAGAGTDRPAPFPTIRARRRRPMAT